MTDTAAPHASIARDRADVRRDLVVVGATPGGIATALRGAREGLTVLLTERASHVGGMLTGGLCVMDTQYDQSRAAIYNEICERVLNHYRSQYGADSVQYQHVQPRNKWPLTAEPHVLQQVLTEMVATEKNVTVATGWWPTAVIRSGRLLRQVEFGEELLDTRQTQHLVTARV